MLVLCRKIKEGIEITAPNGVDKIRIITSKIARNMVWYAIDAPREYKIKRSELEDKPITNLSVN